MQPGESAKNVALGLNQNQGVILVSDGTNYSSARGNAASVATAVQGGIWLPQGVLTNINTPSAQAASTANQLRVFQVTLPFSITVGHANVNISSASSGTVNIGIYDPSGNKLTEASVTCTAGARQASFSPTYTLPAGVYYYAYSISDLTCQASGLATNTVMVLENFGSATRIGTASNPTVSNVMPTTLGTVTASAQPPVFTYIEP